MQDSLVSLVGGRNAALQMHLIDDLRSDLRFFLRSLRRNALLSAVVVLTLTLGIGMDTGVFAMINAIALRPIVDKYPDTYFKIFAEYSSSGPRRNAPGQVTFGDYVAFRQATRSLRELAAWSTTGAILGRDDGSVQVVLATCNLFRVHGADQPKLGRLFVPDDCMNTGSAPVVLSEEVWRDRFGGDPAVVGASIQINDQIFTVAGVAPAGSPAKLNRTVVVWAPYTTQPMFGAVDLLGKSETPWLTLVGRLRPGFSRRTEPHCTNGLANVAL